jgi:prephenate dehydrogenase (NADP+)
VEQVFSSFESKYVYISGEMHDRITADTQAVTHAAFLSMGTAWQANNQFPWEYSRWVGGLENVKINITLRIYSSKWHVYAGLAILNPSAKEQIRQYAQSVTDLYKLMLEGNREELKRRVKTAGAAVFKPDTEGHDLLLKDEVLDRFSLSKGSREEAPPNNHLSLLAIVDCWSKLGIVPYDHMICSTPVSASLYHRLRLSIRLLSRAFLTKLFRLWLGVTEYLFRNPNLLEEALDTAIDDQTFRSDDLEFTFAARVSSPSQLPNATRSKYFISYCHFAGSMQLCMGPKLQPYRYPGYIVLTLVTWDIQAWSDCISFGDFESYRDRFERIQRYFAPRFPEAVRLGNEMMKTILEKTTTESA